MNSSEISRVEVVGGNISIAESKSSRLKNVGNLFQDVGKIFLVGVVAGDIFGDPNRLAMISGFTAAVLFICVGFYLTERTERGNR